MVGALWTGISGLAGSQNALDNESNNIANVNTIGYKASRISFADQFYQDKIGKGVNSFDVEKIYTQGSLKITGVSFDMALSGDGFFQVRNGNDKYYTRAGNFRMGEAGTLEDVGQNKVQGWAMSPITTDDINSTDNNASFFTNDYTKVLGNKIIRDSTTIETIIAKATDYTQTAETDNITVFSGAGWMSASRKVSNVEDLITEYNKALTIYSEADPKPPSTISTVQKDLLDFDLDNPASVLTTSDQIYLKIDGGNEIAVPFDTDEATTFKKFVDLVSNYGYKAHMVDVSNSNPYDPDTSSGTGQMYLEGLIPGKSTRITEFGWRRGDVTNKGVQTSLQQATLGTGLGHINSVRDALSEAVSGKQTDVYTVGASGDMFVSTVPANNNYTYQIDIYDKTLDQNVTIPAVALALNAMADLDAIVAAINDPDHGGAPGSGVNTLTNYVKAYNINGNLVVKTLDANNDVEFTGSLTGRNKEVETVQMTGPVAGGPGNVVITVDGAPINVPVVNGQSAAQVAAAAVTEIIAAGNANIESVTSNGDTITITYTQDAGAIINAAVAPAFGVTGTTVEATTFSTTSALARNANFSIREGAGAEFLQIKTTINQTSSKDDLQLRLDTLKLTDSAFGEFEVDKTGMVTMTQDGVKFAIGQVSVARFTDNRGLNPIGDNLLEETIRSGAAIFNIDNDKTAEIQGRSLELSNSDLSESLVNLMVFQRAFEANAKSITTADQILTTLIQLKR